MGRKMRGKVLPLVVLIVSLLLGSASVSAENPPQDVFNAVMMIQVMEDGTARVDVSVELINPVYREQLREGDFERFVAELVYRNLLNDMVRRYDNLTVYLPEGGPVERTGNWSARVSFYVRPFVIRGKHGLECPYSGPLDFLAGGKVYSFLLRRVILILPKNASLVYAFPDPDDSSSNVLIWDNATFLPMFAFTLGHERNSNGTAGECRPLGIALLYSPGEGRVFFNATFNCSSGLPELPGAENVTYSRSGSSVEVRGYFVPDVDYSENLLWREWKARLELPAGFQVISGGEVSGDGRTVEFTVRKTSPAGMALVSTAMVSLLGVVLVWRWRK